MTINDLKVEKTFYKREKDELGNVLREPYKQKVPRKIELVNPGVRLGYFILDFALFYILFLVGVFIFFSLINLTGTFGVFKNIISEEVMYFLFYFSFYLYYALSEYFFGGTLGKLICGYRVIDENANKIALGQSLLRTIIRFIPFEALTCIGERGWHDKWSKTYVVRKEEKLELQKLLGTLNENTDILD